MITIVVTHEDEQSDEFDFDPSQSTISIGRRSTNDVCIPHLSVSGRHARIVFNEGEAWVEDMNSTNGTYINNRLISRQMLNHNDELVIGKTRVRYQNTAAGSTLDAEVQPISEPVKSTVDEVDAFDDSLDLHSVSDTAAEEATPAAPIEPSPEAKPRVSPAQVAAGVGAAGAAAMGANSAASAVASKASSSEALFESLADDLETNKPVERPLNNEQQPDPFTEDDLEMDSDDEEPMSLSEKAKLALGRSTPRPSLSSVNGRSAAAAVATSSAAAAVAETGEAMLADEPATASGPAPAPQQAEQAEPTPAAPTRAKHTGAVIEIKNGAKSGQTLPIDKPVTTLGRPGIQIAAIMRKPDGYFLMHIESDDSVDRPTLNNDAIGDEPMLLQSGDELNVAGIDVEFNLS